MRKNSAVFYHRVDFDGVISALITWKRLSEDGEGCDCIGYNYGDPLPNITELFDKYKHIYIIDISFPPEYMLELLDKFRLNKVTWIDHHITNIRDSEDYDYQDIMGIREVSYKGACELTWEYFFTHQEVPKLVKLVSANDTWDKGRFNWTSDVMALQSVLRAEFGVNLNNLIAAGVDNILSDYFVDNVLLPKGRTIMKYLTSKWRSQVRNASFEITVNENLKGLAMLTPDFSSAMFESALTSRYQVFCVCNIKKDMPGYFSVSLYSEPDGRLGNFELGEYMRKYYKGGGHKHAAGGILDGEGFKRLVFDKKI